MRNYIVLFGLGAFSYGLLEVLWRGNSHWTMMIAGGIVFVIFSLIHEKCRNIPFLYRCILGSLTVTSVELIFGVIFNVFLGLDVWDYSHIPLNLMGQICLLFSVLWGLLSIIAIPLSGKALKVLKNSEERL